MQRRPRSHPRESREGGRCERGCCQTWNFGVDARVENQATGNRERPIQQPIVTLGWRFSGRNLPPSASFAISSGRPRSLRARRPVRQGGERLVPVRTALPNTGPDARSTSVPLRGVGRPCCHGTRVRDRASLRRRTGEGTIAEDGPTRMPEVFGSFRASRSALLAPRSARKPAPALPSMGIARGFGVTITMRSE
jgi:hypothetical protein